MSSGGPDSLESNFPTMTLAELREWAEELELQAQDAWSAGELRALRRDRDSIRAEIARRGSL